MVLVNTIVFIQDGDRIKVLRKNVHQCPCNTDADGLIFGADLSKLDLLTTYVQLDNRDSAC